MDIEFGLHGKTMLLKEEFKPCLPQCKTNKGKSRCAYLPYIFAIVSILACIITCGCAIYCYNVLAEIKTLQHLAGAKHEISIATLPLTRSPDISAKTSDTVTKADSADSEGAFTPVSTASSDKKEENYLDDLGSEASQFDAGEYDDVEYVDEDYNETSFGSHDDNMIEGSGEIFYLDAKKPIRKRRSTKEDIKKCKKQCKKGKAGKQCRRNCAGKKMNKVQGGKFLSQTNLPAAHFEADMSDVTTQRLVNTKYNKLKQEDEGPLKIFKQAQWVDDSSPVSFREASVATAKSAGIFLVYAQAYIGGQEPEKSIIIVQKRNGKEVNTLSCDNGVNPGTVSSSQMQTCAVFGLMKLEKDDTIEIQRSEVTIGISLDKDKTYFGLFRLGQVLPTAR